MVDAKQVKEASPIVEVAQALGLEVKRDGSGWKIRCFAHNDTGRPNMHLYPDGEAHCFNCGWHGDVFDMVATVRGVDFVEAKTWLAERAGLRDEPRQQPQRGRSAQSVRKPRAGSFNGTMRHEFSPFQAKHTGKTDVKPRHTYGEGLTPDAAGQQPPAVATVSEEDRWAVFDQLLAFAQPVNFDQPSAGHSWLLKQKGVSLEAQRAAGIRWLTDYRLANEGLKKTFDVALLEALGVINALKEDGKGHNLRFFKHRLLFPFYRDYRPVYLQGRDVEAADKASRFVNSGSQTPCLYNVDAVEAAREDGQPVFVCEGATDTLNLAQRGYYAAGIVGTSGFKKPWVREFDGLSVFLTFDGDEAGREAGLKVARVFVDAGQPPPRIVPIPDGLDVTAFFQKGQPT